MNNKKIIIVILSLLILFLAFFSIKNLRDNKVRNIELDYVKQMKAQQNELTQKLQLMEDSLQQLQQNSFDPTRLDKLNKELASLEQQKKANNETLEKKIQAIKAEISSIKKSSNRLASLKKELADLDKKKKGKPNAAIDAKIAKIKKEIESIEKSSKKLPSLQEELASLEKQKKSDNIGIDNKISNLKKEITALKAKSSSKGGDDVEKKLEAQIRELEALQKQSQAAKVSSSDDKEVAKLKKQIEELTNQQKGNSSTSSQDKEEIAKLKKQLADANVRSKNSTSVEGDYSMQIELLRKQLVECKKNSSGVSGGKGGSIDASKEQAYKRQIEDLQKQLQQYNQALSTREKEVSDNIKMLVQNIQGVGLYIDKKSNLEKTTMHVYKMQQFKISFAITSVTPLEGDLTLIVRIYDMATNDVLEIPGIPYVKITKDEGEEIVGSYAQLVTTRGEKKINLQKIFDAGELTKFNKNAMLMVEVYTRKGILLGTQKIKLLAGEQVTTF